MNRLQSRFLRPLIFGILNVTPDSFSDGGDFGESSDLAIIRAEALLKAGADVVDIGAESTRPGAVAVAQDLEWRRLESVLEALKKEGLSDRLSVDTMHPETMLRAAAIGVRWINCVGALPEEETLIGLKKQNPKIGFVATHMHGTPASMQLYPLSVVGAMKRVTAFFESAAENLAAANFQTAETLFDPGIGFGKSDAANVALMARCAYWSQTLPIAIGVSRKGFFKRIFGVDQPKERDPVSKVVESALALSGVKMIRTHDVQGLVTCLSLIEEAMA